ncbi:type IV pilus secretin PilQ [Dokdonella sp.]|uniref:type IV pilus secretin PilQ n=1 Tax=Dokdonella sp. TaxID=2291710 RepID=UPI0025BE4768|nr:type IV pilus secretin PilQ [Dokdonella sp.]
MTKTSVATPGCRPINRWARLFVLAAMSLLGPAIASQAQAENVLRDISYTALPGGKVEVTLKFDGPAVAPQAFATETPPSIALDFADTRNAFAKRRVEIGTGAASSVSALEAGGRTRVVVDLFRAAGYDTRINGNNIVVSINSGVIGSSTAAAAAAKADPTKSVTHAAALEISNIDFRRGKNGEGRVIVRFNGPGAAVNLKREAGNIALELMNVQVPANQARHLDVLDFATPVQSIDTKARGTGARIEIVAKAPYQELAYQSGDEYVVEVAPKKDDVKARGKNAQPEYNGSRVTFNFQDIPTRSVLQLIADVSDLNIVVADSVQGNVTLRLINVPWDQALDIVLQAKGLDKRQRGNVIWVAPQKEIAEREEAIADARLKMETKEELVTDYIPISYGKAKDIAALLTKDTQTNQAGGQAQSGGGALDTRGFLSARGSVSFDDRTNTLLVSDIPSKIQEVRQLIAVLDRPVQQVLIESRIVIATDSFARELGAKFGISGGYEDHNGNVVSTAGTVAGTDQMSNVVLNNRFNGPGRGMPNTAPSQIGGGLLVPTLANRLNVNLPAANRAGAFGLAILGADYLLDLELSAAQTEGRGEVISSPKVITANQREASIKQGVEVGYLQYSGGAAAGGVAVPTVAFKEADLELKVTPTITADDRVVLNLNVKKDSVSGFVDIPGGGSVPTVDKREVSTEVLVDNGQTVVLGGVYEVNKSDKINKVPMLGDVPFIGNLFKNTARSDTRAELLIFVTPRILSDNLK